MERDKRIRQEEIKTKGYDFPKTKIPKELKPVKGSEKVKEGATVFDYIKDKFAKLFGWIGEAKRTISDIIQLVPSIKMSLWLGIILAILIIVIIILA